MSFIMQQVFVAIQIVEVFHVLAVKFHPVFELNSQRPFSARCGQMRSRCEASSDGL